MAEDRTVTVRPRRTDDLPALTRVLADQQPGSGYPVRWPLPFPVEEFLVRSNEEAAWVAEVAGHVVGHVSVCGVGADVGPAFAAAAGTEDLAELAVLFVAAGQTGRGIGGRLIDTAVAWIRAGGRTPVLDVIPTHERALAVYLRRGWRVVGEIRPDWLTDEQPAMVLMTLAETLAETSEGASAATTPPTRRCSPSS